MKTKDAEHIAKTTAANNFSYDEVVEVLTDYRRITRFRVKYEGASQRGLHIFV